MRTEAEMLSLVLDFSKKDERIRLVTLEGSRSRPDDSRDCFQDYDVSYFVSELGSFEENNAWLDYFGPRLIMQQPEAPFEEGLSYLMLFEDGNRLDLFVLPLSQWPDYVAKERSVQVLLDKDQRLSSDFHLQADVYQTHLPTAEEFLESCNEFWWVSTYVVKGLCRGELLYAAAHLEQVVRQELLKVLAWRGVYRAGHPLDFGKFYKYLPRFLTADCTQRLQVTYDLSNEHSIWQALLICQDLFFEASQELAVALAYPFALKEADNVRRYTQFFYEGGSL